MPHFRTQQPWIQINVEAIAFTPDMDVGPFRACQQEVAVDLERPAARVHGSTRGLVARADLHDPV